MLMPAKNGFLSFKQIFIEWALHYWFLVVDKEIGTAKVRSLLSLESRRNTFKAGLPTSKWWLDISWNHQTTDTSSPEVNGFFRGLYGIVPHLPITTILRLHFQSLDISNFEVELERTHRDAKNNMAPSPMELTDICGWAPSLPHMEGRRQW